MSKEEVAMEQPQANTGKVLLSGSEIHSESTAMQARSSASPHLAMHAQCESDSASGKLMDPEIPLIFQLNKKRIPDASQVKRSDATDLAAPSK